MKIAWISCKIHAFDLVIITFYSHQKIWWQALIRFPRKITLFHTRENHHWATLQMTLYSRSRNTVFDKRNIHVFRTFLIDVLPTRYFPILLTKKDTLSARTRMHQKKGTFGTRYFPVLSSPHQIYTLSTHTRMHQQVTFSVYQRNCREPANIVRLSKLVNLVMLISVTTTLFTYLS